MENVRRTQTKTVICNLNKNGPGEYGLGLYLTQQNVISYVENHGRVYISDDSVCRGYKITKINNKRITKRVVDELKNKTGTIHITFEYVGL